MERPSFLISTRFLLAIMIFFGVGFQYMQKIDMGIAIVCMVNSTAVQELYNDTSGGGSIYANDSSCLFHPGARNSTKGEGTYVWSKPVQGFILSSYFFGYILTQIPGGWLTLKFGGKRVLAASMFCGSVMTILLAPIATLGYQWLIVARFITGLFHGFMWPAVSAMFVKWAVPTEKSRLIGFATSGTNIGNVFALQLGGVLCSVGFYHGWGSIFVIFGLMGIVWVILLCLLTSDSPLEHRFIPDDEKDYLVRNISKSDMAINDDDETQSLLSRKKKKQMQAPWRLMFKSKPCLAVFVTHVSVNWGNYLFLTQMPTFMKDVLLFDIESNGLFSSIPYMFSLIFAVSSSLIADRLIHSQVVSKTNVRKIFNSLGLFVPMIAVLVLTRVTCANPYMAVFLLAFGVGFISCTAGAGFIVNINELAGPYSSVLLGISNTFATMSGIVAPYLVGVLTPKGTADEWKIVFYITAAVYFVGGLVYAIFCSAETEKWAILDENENSTHSTSKTDD